MTEALTVGRSLRRHRAAFLRFGLVGCVGFVIDVAAPSLAALALGMGFFGGRALSFLVTPTVTWFWTGSKPSAAPRICLTDGSGCASWR